MRAQNLSTWLGEGRGLPLPSRSHPQKRNRAVYTKELTHLASDPTDGRFAKLFASLESPEELHEAIQEFLSIKRTI